MNDAKLTYTIHMIDYKIKNLNWTNLNKEIILKLFENRVSPYDLYEYNRDPSKILRSV